MSGFDVDGYKMWQASMVLSLASVAKSAKMIFQKDDYFAAMAFGVGAMTATTIVREVLESGDLPSKASMASDFDRAFLSVLSNKDVFNQAYDMANEKED